MTSQMLLSSNVPLVAEGGEHYTVHQGGVGVGAKGYCCCEDGYRVYRMVHLARYSAEWWNTHILFLVF